MMDGETNVRCNRVGFALAFEQWGDEWVGFRL
jgi:hypothetical protein